ncbi:MAG: LuxR C-terminal-related transcriptional regulator [Adhaeribacter sp.]
MNGKKQTHAEVAGPLVREEAVFFQERCALGGSRHYGHPEDTYDQFMEKNPVLEWVLTQCPCITWILDLRTLHFVFISPKVEQVLGFELGQFQQKGKAFWKEIVHPEDLNRAWKLEKQAWEHVLTMAPEERKNFMFYNDYRVIKPCGEVVRLLEQNSVLQLEEQGDMSHAIGICSDITHWHQSPGPVAPAPGQVAEAPCPYEAGAGQLKPPITLSKRELEIVTLMAAGHNSKYIADKLFISFHTVNTHRQKMIEKTSTRNTGGLIQFAMQHGLI